MHYTQKEVLPKAGLGTLPAPPPPVPSGTDPVQQVIRPYGVGIDTHSKFIAVCILRNRAGNVHRKEQEFSTEWGSLKKAHAWVLHHLGGLTDAANLRYCIESTGTYHLPVLKAWRGIPSVVNPVLAGPTRRKTDVLDARLLAHHSITGMWPESFIPSQDAQELRVLWAQRREALRKAGRAANRINNIILRFGHTFGATTGMRTTLAQGILDDLINGRSPHIPGAAPDGLPPSIRPIIRDLLQDLQQGQEATKRATVEAMNFVKGRDWPVASGHIPGTSLLSLLMTVPGVADATALAWLSEVCDPKRFRDSKQVAAYCGCDPSLKVSAGKVTSHTRRAGNSRLHQALSYAAQGLLRQPRESIGLWGKSIAGRHKKGGYKKAVGAISRRIACALWYVHSKAEAFSYAGYNFQLQPKVKAVPLREILKPKALALLRPLKITTSQELSDAFYAGRLAPVAGIGETTLAHIKNWISSNILKDSFVPSPHRTEDSTRKRRVYVLHEPRKRGAKTTQKKG